jgi:DNA gyrase subunit B
MAICRAFFMAEAAYTAKDITVLEGLDPVRLRPGMYIGSTGSRGLHHLVYEVVDNAVDEALAGRNDLVDVTIHPDNSVTVRDAGAGIPVDVIAEQGFRVDRCADEAPRRRQVRGEGYKVSGGLHGVGVSVVNALSEWLVAEVRRDGKVYRQEFARGEPVGDMETIGVAKKDESGTVISFLPDPDVFEETEFSTATLSQRLRETAFLTRGLRIVLRDERAGGKTEEFHYEGGIRDFVSHVNESKDTVHKHVIYFDGETRGRAGRDRDAVERLVRRVGVLVREQHQHDGGRRAPVRLPRGADGNAQPLRTREGPAQGEGGEPRGRGRPRGPGRRDLGEAPQPAVRGPDEDEARQPADRGSREDDREPAARAVPRGEPDRGAADHHEGRLGRSCPAGGAEGARAHAAQERARLQLPPRPARRLPDLGPGVAELFLVEGVSAGGSAVDARDRSYQAILPLRGKVINAEKNRINKVLSNEEIQAIITAIGTGIADEFDIEKLRYHRIIVMTDADVDGAHIRTLILTFLYRQMQELVEGGFVYMAVPPLYRVKIGSQQRYIEKESQFEELLARERIKDMDVTDRRGETQKLTEARYGRLVKVLNEFDGWVSRLREDFGPGAPTSSWTTGSSRGTPRPSRTRWRRAMRTGTSSPSSRRPKTVRPCESSSARRAPRRASSSRARSSRPRSTPTSARPTRGSRRSSGIRRSTSRSERRSATRTRSGSFVRRRSTWPRRACR